MSAGKFDIESSFDLTALMVTASTHADCVQTGAERLQREVQHVVPL